MKIFIELPTWLGDAIMASVAIGNIFDKFPEAKVTVFGSFVATEIYKGFPQVEKIVLNNPKQDTNRYISLYKTSREIGLFDLAFSFRGSSFATKYLLFFVKAKEKYQYKRTKIANIHQVKRYNDFVNKSLGQDLPLGDLRLPYIPKKCDKPLLGLNPGATYGNAKRWYPSEFAKVAIALADKYDIVIFGSPAETEIAHDIQIMLEENNIKNFTNIAGKTSIRELCETIGSLSLFITNDSGPLHIAAAYKIPTIAIFGPTIPAETSGWNNPNEIDVMKKLDCQPCMKRICPLEHHDCMKLITAEDVLSRIE
jgi:heptosyltransferase-2